MERPIIERKLAAILSADVVGYSRLMSRDESGTLAALKKDRRELLDPKAAQYRGRTIKLMGDGALMEFGSVVDALIFAVEVQCAMRRRNQDVPDDQRIVYRIGINIGDIIVEGDDIYGDGVNIASRLEGLAEPGGICISRTVFSHVRGKLDLTIDAMGEHEVKNIPEPVTVYQVVLDQKAESLVTPISSIATAAGSRRSPWLAAAGAAALVGAVALFWWQPWAPDFAPASVERMALPLPDKPSIAVLPFNNFGDDASQDYFADGITEDLITDLSKLSGIFVISRNSSWAFKGRPTKPQAVAEELGVRYLLEGSVRRHGDEVRINAQLIDAVGGQHLWADRYDGIIDDVFALQDKVIGEIVGALAVNLTGAEQAEIVAAETANTQAYDAVLQGFDSLRRGTEEDTLEAIVLFERATELDPDYARAQAALAAANWRIVVSSWTAIAGTGSAHRWQAFTDILARALEHPTSLAHAVSAQFLAQKGRYEAAFAEIERAMALSPNDADNHITKAKILNAIGHAAEAEEAVRWAMRLDPRYSPDYLRVLAISLFNQERYEEAVATLERIVSQRSDVLEDYLTVAASYGHLKRIDDVPPIIEKYNALAIPASLDLITVQEAGWWWDGIMHNYYGPYRDRLQDGLRKAGVPEGAGTDLTRDAYMRLIDERDGRYIVRGATKIDVETARELVEGGDVTFVDVRSPVEFEHDHIPGARNLSLVVALSNESLSEVVGTDEPVAFYCHGEHCPYSAYAAAKALAWGFTRVYYFAGGYPAWVDAGYPVESGAN